MYEYSLCLLVALKASLNPPTPKAVSSMLKSTRTGDAQGLLHVQAQYEHHRLGGLLLAWKLCLPVIPVGRFIPKSLSVVDMLKLGNQIKRTTTAIEIYNFDFQAMAC